MEIFGNETCSDIHNFQGDKCFFVQNVSDCQFDDGFIQYIVKVYCAGSETNSILFLLLMLFWCIVLLLLLATVADEFFGPTLVVIAKLLRFSDNLAGVTLLALGNGAADIFSAIAAARTSSGGDAGLMYGSLLGAGVLVTTVTTACVAFAKPFRTQRRPIMKDIIFYIIAVVWNLSIMIKGYIHLAEALGFIFLYVIYVSITVISRYIRGRMLEKERRELEEEGEKSKTTDPGTPKISRKAKVSRVPGPCQPELRLTKFKRRDDDEDVGAVNLSFTPDPHLTVNAGTSRLAVEEPRGLSPKPSPQPSPRGSPKVSRAPSAASSFRYDGSMNHSGLQRVEGVAVRRSRPVSVARSPSKSRSVSQYHGLTKKLSMRHQLMTGQLSPPRQSHGPRPSYLTQWVMAYRQEDDEAMIPTPDPRDMKRQRSRSHFEIQRDVERMNIRTQQRARSVTFDAATNVVQPINLRDRNGSNAAEGNRKVAGNGSFVEISLADHSAINRHGSINETTTRPSEVTVPGLTPHEDKLKIDTGDDDDDEEEEEYRVPGLWMHFLETINPIDLGVWRSLSLFWKIFEVFRCPIRFILTLIVPLVDCDHPTKGWCKLLIMLQCYLTPIFWTLATKLFLVNIGGVMPVWGIILLAGSLFAGIIFFTSKHDTPPRYHFLFALLGFATSIIWIYSVTNEVVNILPTFGIYFQISKAVLALTFLAWANSVGDIMSNTILAKNNFPRIAISACFGGPLFNLLLGIGIPFTMLTSSAATFTAPVKLTMVQLILVIFLLITLFSHLVLLFLFKFNVKRYYGVYFIIVYIVFVTVAILSETKIIPSVI